MENNTQAVTAEIGVSDISGEKTESVLLPEQNECNARSVAESAITSAEPSPDGETSEAQENEDELEKQFEALINGKFRNAYRKRTESIVRKRLKAGKARPEVKETPRSEAVSAEAEGSPSVSKSLNQSSEAIQNAVSRNKIRPTENGCGGSVGVVSKINVYALSGRDVRSILRRAGAGEKITFK